MVKRAGLTAWVVSLSIGSASALAAMVSAPYSNDFQSGSQSDFTAAGVGTTTTNTFNVVEQGGAGSGQFVVQHDEASSASSSGLDSVQVSNLGPATPNTSFSVSELIRVVSGPSGYGAGMRFLGNTATSNNDSYLTDISNAGQVRFVEFTGGTATIATGGTIPAFAAGKDYQLTVTGVYDALGALSLSLLATDVATPTNFATASLLGDATPRTGQFFGFRDNVGSNGGTLSVQHDNFSVVPEPMSLSIAGIGALGLLMRRRRNLCR